MKEVMVAKLNKEDVVRIKELEQCEEELKILWVEARSKSMAFWEELQVKHSLASGGHYIKGNAIYKQEI